MPWVESIGAVIKGIAVPYGYTLAIWSAGMLAVGRYGHPRVSDVFTFVLGAVAGYLLFDLLSLGGLSHETNYSVEVPSIALLNVLPIIPALLTAFVAREIPWKWLGFPAMGFSATIFYILALGTLFWVWSL